MTEREISSRPVFLVAATTAIAVAGGLGFVVGAIRQERGRSMDLLVAQFEMSSVSMALFGMLLTAGVLALLFGLVSVASRYDRDATDGPAR